MFYEVVMDSGETPNKCTIAPLAGRPDFRIRRIKGLGPQARLPALSAPLLLHHEGEDLSEIRRFFDQVEGIATIDCVWRRLDGLIRRIEAPLPIFARIPDGFRTAYPRVSRYDMDPDGGLATIEAIFVAAALLGNWDPSLFSEYYFGRRFIELNREPFAELGVTEACREDLLPVHVRRPRTSLQRRLDRGKY